MGDRSVTSGGTTFAPQLFVFGDTFTTMIYTVSGEPALLSPESLAPTLRDDKGSSNKLNQLSTLMNLEQVQIGALVFEPPALGTQRLQLELQMSTDKVGITLVNIQSDGSQRPGGTFYPDGYWEQGNYRFSINGLALVKGDRVAQAKSAIPLSDEELDNERATRAANAEANTPPSETPPTRTPPEVNPSALDLAEGKPIYQQATIRIQDLKSGKVQYLYLVILDDGQVKSMILE